MCHGQRVFTFQVLIGDHQKGYINSCNNCGEMEDSFKGELVKDISFRRCENLADLQGYPQSSGHLYWVVLVEKRELL